MSITPAPPLSRKEEIKRKQGGRLTALDIRTRAGAGSIVMLTAYTARMAELLDPHCDILLVGDSLANVVYGFDTTLAATPTMMAAHGAAVVRGSQRALVVIDMPFRSYEGGRKKAFKTASLLMQATGAGAVKIEGGSEVAETVSFLQARGIPVMGHVGVTPQSVHTLGGYRARGKTNDEFARIMDDATALEQAGAFAVVVEAVTQSLASSIAGTLSCPTIGIGASGSCSGQVLVTDDMLGITQNSARFVKRFDDLAGRIDRAAAAYASSVRDGKFPEAANLY